eukprot:COSAG01_NODE_29836_length_628_cov_1.438563_1_plen_125_part_00
MVEPPPQPFPVDITGRSPSPSLGTTVQIADDASGRPHTVLTNEGPLDPENLRLCLRDERWGQWMLCCVCVEQQRRRETCLVGSVAALACALLPLWLPLRMPGEVALIELRTSVNTEELSPYWNR